jgi:competence protein ComEA
VLLSVLAASGGLTLLLLGRGDGQATPPPPALVVDLNTAPPEVLRALPRLGPVLVDRIVAAREEAPFRSIEDFDARVKGIGAATVRALRPHVMVAPPVRPSVSATPPRLAATERAAP